MLQGNELMPFPLATPHKVLNGTSPVDANRGHGRRRQLRAVDRAAPMEPSAAGRAGDALGGLQRSCGLGDELEGRQRPPQQLTLRSAVPSPGAPPLFGVLYTVVCPLSSVLCIVTA